MEVNPLVYHDSPESEKTLERYNGTEADYGPVDPENPDEATYIVIRQATDGEPAGMIARPEIRPLPATAE